MAQLAGRTRSIGAERMALDAPASLARRGLFSARTGVGLDEQPRPAPEPRGAPQSRPQLGRATGTGLGFGASQCVLENLGVRSDARPAAGTTPEFPQLQQCTASPASLPPRLAPRRASRRPAAPPRSTLGARRDGSAASPAWSRRLLDAGHPEGPASASSLGRSVASGAGAAARRVPDAAAVLRALRRVRQSLPAS